MNSSLPAPQEVREAIRQSLDALARLGCGGDNTRWSFSDEGLIRTIEAAISHTQRVAPSDELAELRAQIARLTIRTEAYENAYRIAYQATFQSHAGHWDKTGQRGAGCPECIRAREARENCDKALRDGLGKLTARALLLQPSPAPQADAPEGYFTMQEMEEFAAVKVKLALAEALQASPAPQAPLSDDLCDAYGVPRGSTRGEVTDDAAGVRVPDALLKQEPLGEPFQKVLMDNLDQLYRRAPGVALDEEAQPSDDLRRQCLELIAEENGGLTRATKHYRNVKGVPLIDALDAVKQFANGVMVDAEPIPPRVYWAPLADNFYDADGKGQGNDFYRKWKPRRAEFPQGESFGWGKGSAHNPFKDPPRTDGVTLVDGECLSRKSPMDESSANDLSATSGGTR